MSDFQLGVRPYDFVARLARGADFNQTLRTKDDEDFGEGPLELRFADDDATVWTATIVANEATWSEDKTDVDALIAGLDGGTRGVRLFYGDINWGNGQVIVDG